jgi:hypothetical protein
MAERLRCTVLGRRLVSLFAGRRTLLARQVPDVVRRRLQNKATKSAVVGAAVFTIALHSDDAELGTRSNCHRRMPLRLVVQCRRKNCPLP